MITATEGLMNIQMSSTASSIIKQLGILGADRKWVIFKLPRNRKSQIKYAQSIKNLEKRKIIVRQNKKGKTKFKFLERGVIKYLRIKMEWADQLPEGQACLVVFDVPEKNKEIRKKLRRFLVNCGFGPIQKSVWISQLDVAEPLAVYFQIIGMEKWVKIFNTHKKEC